MVIVAVLVSPVLMVPAAALAFGVFSNAPSLIRYAIAISSVMFLAGSSSVPIFALKVFLNSVATAFSLNFQPVTLFV